MPRQIFRASCLAFLLALSLTSCQAQTLSNCRPTPPMPPNAKPGVGGLSLSRDGKTLVVAGGDDKIIAGSGNDGMLKIWDVRTGKELKSLVHINSADIDMATYSFVFSRDGKKVYAGNGDGTISEWDVDSGKETKVWKAHDYSAFKLLFSPDYRLLASFGDSVVKLWDTSTWREVRSFSMPRTAGDAPRSSSIAFSNDGNLIAASDI